ncbi:hypothetical protein [Catellatospora tritici]|uniref:hypothetical protein n=1 Tax=Catellatospora tritici TaxID=2851566 RepID=UPI001C2D85B9|nr:hypothetical protein [Catellatospora tritici]MBV1853564.1 hypothetical protein [Catellatospora tritici]
MARTPGGITINGGRAAGPASAGGYRIHADQAAAIAAKTRSVEHGLDVYRGRLDGHATVDAQAFGPFGAGAAHLDFARDWVAEMKAISALVARVATGLEESIAAYRAAEAAAVRTLERHRRGPRTPR